MCRRVNIQPRSYSTRLLKKVIRYPDGEKRIVSMSSWYWDRVQELEKSGISFQDLLEGALHLSHKFPSKHGYERDLFENLGLMIRTAYASLCEDRLPSANDNTL